MFVDHQLLVLINAGSETRPPEPQRLPDVSKRLERVERSPEALEELPVPAALCEAGC